MPAAPADRRPERSSVLPLPPRARGFTLIELLVVLVIMAALAGLVATRFDGALAGMELRAAARDIASALRYARGRAVATQNETAVIVNVETRRYRLRGTADEREHRFGRHVGVDLVTDRNSFLSDHEAEIRFFPDGSSTGARITLVSGQSAFRIDVEWLTGRVRIHDAAPG